MKQKETEEEIEFEFFDSSLPKWVLDSLKRMNEPNAINQSVAVKKYMISVRLVVEPKDIYIERLLELYKKENNWHNKDAIQNYLRKNFKLRIIDNKVISI